MGTFKDRQDTFVRQEKVSVQTAWDVEFRIIGFVIIELPGRSIIDEPKVERWFCTEAEARAAGGRRSKR